MDHNSFSKCQAIVFGVLGCMLAGGQVLRAQEAGEGGDSVTNRPVFKVDVRRDVEGASVPYRIAFISAGDNKYTFLVPDLYRVDTPDPAKIKMASPDYATLIAVGIADNGATAEVKMDVEALRARVLAKYADVTIKAEQSCSAAGQTGPGFDFLWKSDSGLTRMSRTTFIPTPTGLMEFSITASPEKFEASLTQLNLVLLTFRSSTNGKFDYVVGSKYP